MEDISRLSDPDAKRPEARRLLAQSSERIRQDDLAKRRTERLAYAKDYERALLSAGQDATVRARGSNADTLVISFVLINRPFVYNTQNDSDLNSLWSGLGFTKVVLTDGYDTSWSYKLDKN